MPSIRPERWSLIPVEPKFGSLLDDYGGRNIAANMERNLNTLRNTQIGIVEFREDEKGLNIHADEMGLGLYYEKGGKLTQMGVDLSDFCQYISEEDIDKMGGEPLNEMLEILSISDHQITFNFDLKNMNLVIMDINREDDDDKVLSVAEEFDPKKTLLLMASFKGYVLGVGFRIVDDVLKFGIMVKAEEDKFTPDTNMLMYSVLTDCNYETFLSDSSTNKYEKLINRIFLTKD